MYAAATTRNPGHGGSNVILQQRWKTSACGTLILFSLLAPMTAGCNGAGSSGSTKPGTSTATNPGQNTAPATAVECALNLIGGTLSKVPEAVQRLADFRDTVSRLHDIAQAMEFVYGKNAYDLSPDEQADLALILFGLESCAQTSNVLNAAVHGVFNLQLLKGFNSNESLKGKICLAPGETPWDDTGKPKPPQDLHFVPCAQTTVSTIAGTWTGSYFCSQGRTGLRLVITSDSGDAVAATFSFFPLPSNPNVPSGSYAMTGTYTAIGLSLKQDHWIDQPSGYEMVDLVAPPIEGGNTLSGTVEAAGRGCTTFSLRKS
ncbi:MAG: serine/threonine protein kinase [Actinomycetia bacterium]|nr:serine/threonine protein kinase [Actinomycetes bacterium]